LNRRDSSAYLVRAAIAEDINAPYLWINPLRYKSRDIVKVVNKESSKAVWCEVIKASDNFIERYNSNPRTKNISKDTPFLVANQWYRDRLGISKNTWTTIELRTPYLLSYFPSIVKTGILQLLASKSHPDYASRLAFSLALVSIVLGLIGLFLGWVKK
jgi:hypothetical protein